MQIRLYIKQILTQTVELLDSKSRVQVLPRSSLECQEFNICMLRKLPTELWTQQIDGFIHILYYSFSICFQFILFGLRQTSFTLFRLSNFGGIWEAVWSWRASLGAPFLEFSIYVSIAGNFETVESLLGNQMEEIYMQFLGWSKI